ncbi:MAG: ATP-dependent zinc metalloprotease FtsH [Rhabdochlamydiaceae bacterium]|nr:ATP-dependent zinc metalloprotease FtsH [Rhabdochlamydiaceae bacterium]
MNDDNKQKPEQRKGFPGGFVIFLLAALLIFLTVQNLSQDQTAKVAFSHQVEHLVDLDLIQPSESRKIAQNDNLVTLTGKFRDRITDDAKARFKYLDFLNRHNELTESQGRIQSDLSGLQKGVLESADWFLHLSGISLPSHGYWIVTPMYDTPERENGIVLKTLSDKPITSLTTLQKEFPPSANDLTEYGKELSTLLVGFKSPTLGIGSEPMKQQLKSLDQMLAVPAASNQEQLVVYSNVLSQLQAIVNQLNTEQDNARLVQLRSVRSYLGDVVQLSQVSEDLSKNDIQLDKAREAVASVTWFFNNQELSTRALEKQNPEAFTQWFTQAKKEWDAFPSNKGTVFKVPDQPRTLVLDKTFKSEEPSPNYLGVLFTILPFLLLGFLFYFIFARQMKGVGNSAMNFGKSPAKMLTKERNKLTFKDVAGCDEAKEELQEIVEFLKDPGKFTALGARIPKGVLCIGAPGTGKTLIAKAVAGEADRPFFFISGSDFVEMFVGVGASRIRDMFNEARKYAPCIIFMDEIDAVGRHRGAGIGGGHDEREQTLNQLLVEMDGFDPTEGIILIAATNRPDVLDKALLRPGRFDRRVIIDLPDIKGRFEILKVHARKIKLDPSVDLMDIARATPGASGADLANILNEAALLAARRNRAAVTSQEAREAVDKVKYGKERRSLEIDENEKRTTAYHESGHAIVALVVKSTDPVDKVTIIPRGMSLGATHFMPKKNRLSYWKKELISQLAVLMGGRAAEEIFVGDMSSGAQMDITQATRLARSMVCEWGMSPLGTVAYDERQEAGQYLGMNNMSEKSYSDETAKQIDIEVRKMLDQAHEQAIEVINQNRDKVELMTQMLMEFETLDKDDVKEMIEGTWDIEKKRARLKVSENLQKKSPEPVKPKATPDMPEPQQA